MRAFSLAALWLAMYYLLAQYGVHLLPASTARSMTLPTYLAAVQITTLLLGVTFVLIATRRHLDLRSSLLPETRPLPEMSAQLPQVSSRASSFDANAVVRFTLWALLLAPAAYFCAHSLAMHLAYDTLIAELAARGARVVQQQTGELGRSATQDTLWRILPFTVLIAPLGEELLFRGGIYGAVQHVVGRGAPPQAPPPETAPESMAIAGLPRKSGPGWRARFANWSRAGGAATLASTAVFGLMHADMPGGLGIVRVVSATALGLSCGLLRFCSGGLVAPLALHAGYNFLALATMRRWLVFESWPTSLGVPTILRPVSVVLVCVVLVHVALRMRALRKSATR